MTERFEDFTTPEKNLNVLITEKENLLVKFNRLTELLDLNPESVELRASVNKIFIELEEVKKEIKRLEEIGNKNE